MSTSVSVVILGDDLHTGVVSASPLGVRTKAGPTLRSFLSMAEAEARRTVADLSAGRLIVTIPASWCATRPVQITPEQWGGARAEITASIDRLLPIPPEEAMVGLIGLADEQGETSGGALVATRRSQVEAWTLAIEAAFGRPIDALLTPHMALMGLGLQHEERAVVVERLESGLETAHTLRWGRLSSIGEALEESPSTGARTLFLPDESGSAGNAAPGETILAHDLVESAALAEHVAPDAFAPVEGRRPRRTPAWLAPAAAALVALVFIIGAGPARDARLAAAAEEAEQAQRALEDDLVQVQDTRRRAERLVRLLDQGVRASTEDWSSPLPALREGVEALGDEGFLRRVEVTPDRLRLRGEAAQAGDLLERLESSPLLEGAAMEAPLSRSSASGLDIFEIRAERASSEGARP